MTDVKSNQWLGPLCVFIGGVCIGFAPIALRDGLDYLGPQAIAMWRFFFAAPLLFVLVLLVQKRRPVRPNKFILLCGVFFALNVAFWHWSLTITTVSNATFVVSLGNLFAGFVAWLVLKVRPNMFWFLAVFIALIGASALTQGGGGSGKGVLHGDLIAIIAAIFVSFYLVFAKIARREISGLDAIFWLTCVEFCVLVVATGISGETFVPESIDGFKAPLFLAIVVQIIGQGLIIYGIGSTPAAIAGVLVVVQPVVASAVAWGRFDEPMTFLQIGGGLLILLAIALSQFKPRPT